jgi:hypothetical protein
MFLRLPSLLGMDCTSIWLCRLDSPMLLHISLPDELRIHAGVGQVCRCLH